MSVHYKFKNTINYDAVKFDGVYISNTDLKSIIAQQKKLNHSELQIVNEETGHSYKDDESIPKNTNVIVIRMPFANANKRPRLAANHNNHHNSSGNHHNNHHGNNSGNHQNSNSQSGTSSSSDYHSSSGAGREVLELVSTKNMSEEEKIKYIQTQSTKDFDPARYARGGRGGYRGGRGGGGHRHFVHPGYTCRKCGIPGHSIYDCKMGARGMPKRSSGIPRDFLMKVDSKEKGALMTPSGEYAVPYIDREAYNNPKVEKAPFFEDGTPSDDTPTSSSKTPTTLAIQ